MDWIDIGLHALGAAGFTFLVWWVSSKDFYKHNGSFIVVFMGGAFWIIREMAQHNGSPFASAQSVLEWTVPLGVSVLLGVFLFSVNEAEDG